MSDTVIDMHVHLHEFKDDEIENLLESQDDLYLVAVSDDYESSKRTVQIALKFPNRVKPCLGLHPWEVKHCKDPIIEAERVVDLALKHEVDCLGEVGLDTKFVAETIDIQRKVFHVFLEASQDHDLMLNVHAAGTWSEVLELLKVYSVRRANIHWYTGPLELLQVIAREGYTISVNPAVKLQRKHQEVVKVAPLDIITFESDAPYEYRGLKLSPLMIREVIAFAAELRGVPVDTLTRAALANSHRVLRWP